MENDTSQEAAAAAPPSTDELLARHLAAFDAESAGGVGAPADGYRVEEVLKASAWERTEVVYFAGAAGGELGPFVRKRIDLGRGVGSAYEALYRAERDGARFLHLPRIVECRERGGELTVVMELVPGETLVDLVRRLGPSPDLARRVVPALCEAVSELHERFDPPIIHRDLTPSNVIVSPSALTLIDLGIARSWQPGAQTDTVHFGTRAYAPPEQFGFGQTDARSDVYALGSLAAFLCTGADPEPPADGDLERAGVPAPVVAVVRRARAFDPAARYGSARALAAAFTEAAEAAAAGEAPAGAVVAAAPARPAPVGADGAGVSVAAEAAPSRCDPRRGPGAPSGSALLPYAAREAGAYLLRAITSGPSHVLGLIWNAFDLLMLALLLGYSIEDTLHPAGTNAGDPLWYRALMTATFIMPFFIFLAYLALDKRRLRTRFPALRRLTARRALVCALLYGLADLVALFAAYLIGGLG